MLYTPEFYSYLAASIGFLILSALLLVASRKKQHGWRLIIACLASFLWALTIALNSVNFYVPRWALATVEWARYMSWFYFLFGYLLFTKANESPTTELASASGSNRQHYNPWGLVFAFSTLTALLAPVFLPAEQFANHFLLQLVQPETLSLIALIILSIVGMGIIEQLIRHSSVDQRWSIKYICLGIGALFAYDFFMFSEALLFKAVNEQLWQARGLVNVLVIPMITVSAARHTRLNLGIHVSRHVVFQSATTLGAGIYLISMSAMGYYIRYLGGSWGDLFQILFLFVAGLLLASLLFSDKFRMNLKVILNKHFYSYKYDYRKKWLEFTHNLANSEATVPIRSCQAMAKLVNASGALLWCKDRNDKYELLSHWHIPEPDISEEQTQRDLEPLRQFLENTMWVIDFEELRNNPERYHDLELPNWLLDIPKAWLIVPLIFQSSVLGIIFLKKSDISQPVNWEDRDLLKMAGQQVAIHLVQHRSEQALIEARQFEAYNRLSAYVMHDLKNILAQQSLIVSNAEKHRDNPLFFDDVIQTVHNSVDRMNRLLRQMKRGQRSEPTSFTSLRPLLEEVIEESHSRQPHPVFKSITHPAGTSLPAESGETAVLADPSQLKNVFMHLVQNAQEATPDDGTVELELHNHADHIEVVIKDSGHGMDSHFIKERLFKAFDTTKGLMGMGIGVYESRQYIQSIGGNIEVESLPGSGSVFRVLLPAYTENSVISPSSSTAGPHPTETIASPESGSSIFAENTKTQGSVAKSV